MRLLPHALVLLATMVMAGGAHAGFLAKTPGGDLPGQYPGAPRPLFQSEPASPYAMNYTDEVAQSLGIKDGHIDVFDLRSVSDSLVPSVSGGIDAQGAMLKLQWHPGE